MTIWLRYHIEDKVSKKDDIEIASFKVFYTKRGSHYWKLCECH